jgi:hypothetical protein
VELDFLIVGVARCGTTSLFHYLIQHPQVGMPKIKEPKFLSSLDLQLPQQGIGDETVNLKIVKSEEEYFRLFEGLESFKCIGEGSSDCFYYHKNVIPRIIEKWGNSVKIIVCLRNPVDRAFSAYNNLIRDSREPLSFSEALQEEDKRISENWDWMWHYKNGGLYADALEHFMNVFSHVHVVLLEELQHQPRTTMNTIFRFLNVDEDFEVDTSTKYSTSGKPKNKIISTLTSRQNPIIFKIREALLKTIPRKYLEEIGAKLFHKAVKEVSTKKELTQFFGKDIKKLEKLTGRD